MSHLCLLMLCLGTAATAEKLPWIEVARDGRSFVEAGTQKRFVPWGFNYDHDVDGRLLEDYWDTEWPKVEAHFQQMKRLGANVVRIHLQFSKFMESPTRPTGRALEQLGRLIRLAEQTGLYLDLTGLGCYHKKDVPAWYDVLEESARWQAQAHFWEAVARVGSGSPAVFCYDLMNEPVVPVGRRKPGDWLGPDFAGKHFVQVISLDQNDRPRPDIARQWIHELVTAIRRHDRHHLITVGLVDWSLDRKGLTSGFVPEKVAPELDFLCVHLYPERGKVDAALETLAGFAVGKPVLIEETFPLKCTAAEFEQFLDRSEKSAAGWIGFYWGKPPEELRKGNTIADKLLLAWLELFEKRARKP